MSVPAFAQSESDAIKAKDAQIAQLTAEVERLKAALAAQTPSPAAPATTTTTTTTTATAPAPVSAGAVTTTTATDANGDKVLQMSAFEVRTTQGIGYSAGNSASALKTSESLMNLPGQIIVVTNDMIRDLNSHNATDALAFAGVVPYYRGPALMIRGSRIGNAYTDDVPQSTGIGISDNTNIDTYQIIKGPEQVLYPLASLGGLVLQTTKKPLPNREQYIVQEQVMQYGRSSTTADFNQPLGKFGDATLTARINGIYQEGQGPFYNSKDDRYGIFGAFSIDWRNSTVIAQYGAETFHYLPGGTGILTPNGGLYVGLGHRNQMSPPNNFDKDQQTEARLSWTQILSENWQVKSQGALFNVRRYGSTGFPTGVNWNNNTVTYTIRRNNGYNMALDVQTDVSGKYDIFGLKASSAFGFNLHDQTGISAFWIGTPVTIPIGDANAINNIVLPSVYGYTPPANPGSRTKTYVSNGYFSETLEVIPNWLTLEGGLTYSSIETFQDTNLALRNPFTLVTDAPASELLHRFGAVLHLTNQYSAYFTESTTFNPAVGVTYQNTPLPSVLGKSDEVGAKANLFNGKLTFSAAIYKMTLTNQAILAAFPALNIAGLNYYIPIGSTTSKGWDASLTANPLPGWQLVATGYIGTVHDQNGNPIPATVENSWSVLTRYDFNHSESSANHGLAIGAAAYKAGGKWFTMSGMTLPGGVPLPVNSSGNAIFKLQQDVLANVFGEYRFDRHWTARIDVENVFDKAFPIGAQGVGLVDAVGPRTFTFTARYQY